MGKFVAGFLLGALAVVIGYNPEMAKSLGDSILKLARSVTFTSLLEPETFTIILFCAFGLAAWGYLGSRKGKK